MKLLNKILIIPIILSCFFTSLIHAETDDSDCGLFGVEIFGAEENNTWFSIVNQSRETNNWFASFLTIDQQKAIITKNDLNVAILNLQKYCCEKKLWWLTKDSQACKKNKTFFNDNSLDSPYLFDHLFDVIMRRLNWLSGEKNIYKNMTLDDKWSERRKWIDEKATATEGTSPQTIINKYQEFRQQSSSDLWYNITQKLNSAFNWSKQEFLNYVWWLDGNEESTTVSNALKHYNERTLYDRYTNACALSTYFYSLLSVFKEWTSTDKSNVLWKISYSSCTNLTQKQIIWENNYVSLVTRRSSNLFLSNYLEWYIDYLYSRQSKLQDLWTKTKDRWLDVIRGVPCLQRTCTK